MFVRLSEWAMYSYASALQMSDPDLIECSCTGELYPFVVNRYRKLDLWGPPDFLEFRGEAPQSSLLFLTCKQEVVPFKIQV